MLREMTVKLPVFIVNYFTTDSFVYPFNLTPCPPLHIGEGE
jgi:hypothetical protein